MSVSAVISASQRWRVTSIRCQVERFDHTVKMSNAVGAVILRMFQRRHFAIEAVIDEAIEDPSLAHIMAGRLYVVHMRGVGHTLYKPSLTRSSSGTEYIDYIAAGDGAWELKSVEPQYVIEEDRWITTVRISGSWDNWVPAGVYEVDLNSPVSFGPASNIIFDWPFNAYWSYMINGAWKNVGSYKHPVTQERILQTHAGTRIYEYQRESRFSRHMLVTDGARIRGNEFDNIYTAIPSTYGAPRLDMVHLNFNTDGVVKGLGVLKEETPGFSQTSERKTYDSHR